MSRHLVPWGSAHTGSAPLSPSGLEGLFRERKSERVRACVSLWVREQCTWVGARFSVAAHGGPSLPNSPAASPQRTFSVLIG